MFEQLNKLYIGTNMKMYKTIQETKNFLRELSVYTEDIKSSDLELFVIPSYTALETARQMASSKRIKIGAQNMCWAENGQFTGEISPLMLKEVGVDLVMVGHSERRHIFDESDEEINKKVLSAIEHGFTALMCIGETQDDKIGGTSDETLRLQLKRGLQNVTKVQAPNLWIAYEPVWAIGESGKPASETYANTKHKVIKQCLNELFGESIGRQIPILYGGSVNNLNAPELAKMDNIDGLFIGRSAWNAKNFNQIIRHVLPLFQEKQE